MPGAVGELIYKPTSGTALTEYYKNPEATAEKTRGGWIRSGDLAYQDADGYFFFVDRQSDFMRLSTVTPTFWNRLPMRSPQSWERMR